MRKVLLFIFISSCAYAAQNPGNNPTFNNNPTISPNIPIYNTVNPQFITNTTSTINAVGVQMRDVALTMMQKVQETCTKENYNTAKEAIKVLLWQYRYNIAATILVTAYCSTNVLLLHDYHYLKDTQRWSRWKNDYILERLYNITHHELEQELIRAIGEQHVNKKNPTDLSHPLITFIETIEHEIKTCKRYLLIAKTIKQLHLSKIFPINDSKEAEINSCLERALFTRHIFLSWLTERNLTSTSLRKIKGHHERFNNKTRRASLLTLCYPHRVQ